MSVDVIVTYTGGPYTHTDNPQVTISKTNIYNENGDLQGVEKVWTIVGTLVAPTLWGKVGSLEAAYASATITKIAIKDSSERQTLEPDGGEPYLFLQSISYPKGSQSEALTKRTYEIVISNGSELVTEAEQKTEYTVSVNTSNQNGIVVTTYSGSVIDSIDSDATTVLNTLIAAQDWRLSTPVTNTVVTGDVITVNDLDERADFSFEHTYYPSGINVTGGIRDFSLTEGETTDPMNVVRKTLSGSFTADTEGNANTALTAIKLSEPAYIPVKISETWDPKNRKLSFSLDYISAASGSTVLGYSQTLGISKGENPFVVKPLLVGNPVKQMLGKRSYTAMQTGWKTTRDFRPTPEVPFYPNDLQSENVTYSGPSQQTGSGAYSWKVTWTYAFEKTTDFTIPNSLERQI